MTETPAPYDVGMHSGFHILARCGEVQVATLNGKVYLLRDDETRDRVRDLKPVELDALVGDLARLVDRLRNDLVEIGKSGPLALGAVGEIIGGNDANAR